jgi:exocyst complex component 2
LSNQRTRHDVEFGVEYQRRIQGAFLDALYAFLDGLVHVAFSDPEQVVTGVDRGVGGEEETGRPKEVDVRDVVSLLSLSLFLEGDPGTDTVSVSV